MNSAYYKVKWPRLHCEIPTISSGITPANLVKVSRQPDTHSLPQDNVFLASLTTSQRYPEYRKDLSGGGVMMVTAIMGHTESLRSPSCEGLSGVTPREVLSGRCFRVSSYSGPTSQRSGREMLRRVTFRANLSELDRNLKAEKGSRLYERLDSQRQWWNKRWITSCCGTSRCLKLKRIAASTSIWQKSGIGSTTNCKPGSLKAMPTGEDNLVLSIRTPRACATRPVDLPTEERVGAMGKVYNLGELYE